MKKTALLLIICLLSIPIFSQDTQSSTLTEEQKTDIIAVTTVWMEEMFKAEDIDKLIQLSDVPFALDKTAVVTDKNELKEVYASIFENKGKRDIPKFEVKIEEHKFEIIDNCIPLNFAKVLVSVQTGDGESKGVLICVSIRENSYRVVGFND